MCQICKGHPNCPVCGDDKVTEVTEKCYYCEGTGKIPYFVNDYEMEKDCPKCHGTGERTYYL